ncbi:MAG: LeuA family protein [Acidobacteriota bacterium]|nr:LeuA family protein [Acidobacteriota bacterium]MDH3786474.1 LeuA family protein [Acidobacteriota bacterium]
MSQESLIHDWNLPEDPPVDASPKGLMLDDETLRDGLQSPSVIDPPIAAKKKILHLMDELGIDTANVGLPGAGPRAVADVEALCREIADQKLSLTANCAARTMIRDIEPIVAASQSSGLAVEASLFIGSSPIRQFAEGWDESFLLKQTTEAIRFAVGHGLPVLYVTEDTSRARPETIRKLYGEAVRLGVKRVCVTDTVGHATPAGVARLIRFVREVVDEAGGNDVGIDWHGHRDRGMGLINSLAAFRAGATRVHGCGLGIGERCGNTELDLVMVNMKLLGWIDRDLSKLGEYCRAVSEATGVPIPSNYPVVGTDAFETATGVHAAAVIKAYRKGDDWLADRIYSGVAAGEFGARQKIRIGPMSGRSNVIFWLEQNGIESTDERVDIIFDHAKQSDRLLRDDEILQLLGTTVS